MSDYLKWIRRLNLKLPTLAQHRACLYLERHGKRFLVDFGIVNAQEIARHDRLLRDITRLRAKR